MIFLGLYFNSSFVKIYENLLVIFQHSYKVKGSTQTNGTLQESSLRNSLFGNKYLYAQLLPLSPWTVRILPDQGDLLMIFSQADVTYFVESSFRILNIIDNHDVFLPENVFKTMGLQNSGNLHLIMMSD